MRRLLTPSVRLAFGLVFLTSTLVVVADLLGLTPDPKRAHLDARVKLVETITVQIAAEVEKGDIESVEQILHIATKRSQDVLSAGLRDRNGALMFSMNDHEKQWTLDNNDPSTPDQIHVPIFKGDGEWGHVEFRFKALHHTGPFGLPLDPLMLRMAFFATLGYLLYFFFLRRALKYLDPSSVVPERVRAAMNALSEGVLILDEKARIVLANESFIDKTKIDHAALIGKKPDELPWKINGRDTGSTSFPWTVALTKGKSVASVYLSVFSEKTGDRTFVVNVAPILNDKGRPRGALATFDDVTQVEQKNNQLKKMLVALKKTQHEINLQNQKLSVLASTDPLTGCLNRRAFFSIVKSAFETARVEHDSIACIMLDIDFFKKINDNYGHSIGDLVLSTVADCLKNALRSTDLLCRYGGEEFCIILRKSSITNAQALAERIRESIEKLSFEHNPAAQKLRVSCSFGVSDISFDAVDVEQLIDQADQSLYVSKESGRNRVTRFDQITHDGTEAPPKTHEDTKKTTVATTASSTQAGDILTGLSERHAFLQSVRQALDVATTRGESLALLIIDIDHLRKVNTTLGYAAGDQLIVEVASRLSRLRRNTDQLVRLGNADPNAADISRLGSDEFGLIVRDFGDASNIYTVAKRYIQSLATPLKIGDHEVQVSASIGIAVFPDDGQLCEELVNSAERALQQAKQDGGNMFRRSSLHPDAERLIQIETALHGALERGEFRLFYQPKIDLGSNQIIGMEALLRWTHPTLGEVPPATFIPIAENSGLISTIGQWTLAAAATQTKLWHTLGFEISTAVNISTLQLKRDDFYNQFTTICSEAQLDPRFLEIEITESVLMEHVDNVVALLLEFHQLGVKIAVDDFGVGYSSLNYIKRLPIDTLKIDRSFVKDIPTDKDDAVIVSAIIAMARAMNLKTVAEGVEDLKQLAILRRLRCNAVQGYLFSKPVNAEAATTLLQKSYEVSISKSTPSNPMDRTQHSIPSVQAGPQKNS